jgi:hypothetical protein
MIHGVSAPGLSARPYFHRYTEDAIDLCDVFSSFSPQGKATGDNPIYPRASYVVSAREWDLWADPNVLQRLPGALPKERIVGGAQSHFARIRDKVRMVRGGDEIVSDVRVLERQATPRATSRWSWPAATAS